MQLLGPILDFRRLEASHLRMATVVIFPLLLRVYRNSFVAYLWELSELNYLLPLLDELPHIAPTRFGDVFKILLLLLHGLCVGRGRHTWFDAQNRSQDLVILVVYFLSFFLYLLKMEGAWSHHLRLHPVLGKLMVLAPLNLL